MEDESELRFWERRVGYGRRGRVSILDPPSRVQPVYASNNGSERSATANGPSTGRHGIGENRQGSFYGNADPINRPDPRPATTGQCPARWAAVGFIKGKGDQWEEEDSPRTTADERNDRNFRRSTTSTYQKINRNSRWHTTTADEKNDMSSRRPTTTAEKKNNKNSGLPIPTTRPARQPVPQRARPSHHGPSSQRKENDASTPAPMPPPPYHSSLKPSTAFHAQWERKGRKEKLQWHGDTIREMEYQYFPAKERVSFGARGRTVNEIDDRIGFNDEFAQCGGCGLIWDMEGEDYEYCLY